MATKSKTVEPQPQVQPQPQTRPPYQVPIVLKPGAVPPAGLVLEPMFLDFKFAQMELTSFVDAVARARRYQAALDKWLKAASEVSSARRTLVACVRACCT